jgi:DNA recombination protein RmuC
MEIENIDTYVFFGMFFLLSILTIVSTYLIMPILIKKSLIKSNSESDNDVVLREILNQNNQSLDTKISNYRMETENTLSNLINTLDGKIHKNAEVTNSAINNFTEKVAILDESKKSITSLSESVKDFSDILVNKQSRGLLGEIQLEQIISNIFPKSLYEMQYILSNSTRVDCAVRVSKDKILPIDSKFPLESYKKIINEDDQTYFKKFKTDIKKHIDDISRKYIIENETSNFAVMFIPSNAIYEYIYDKHHDLIEYSIQKRVTIVSPPTLSTILITYNGLFKDEIMSKEIIAVKNLILGSIDDSDRLKKRLDSCIARYKQLGDEFDGIKVSLNKICSKHDKIKEMDIESEEKSEEKSA